MLFPFMFGAGAGAGASKVFEAMPKTKKEISLTEAGKKGGAITGGILGYQRIEQEFHEPYETYQPSLQTMTVEPLAHYAPQLQFAPVTSYGYQGATTIIDSPEARVSKKQVMDIVSKPEMRGEWDFPISQTATPSWETGDRPVSGINATHIALIAAAALIGATLIKKKKGGKRG